MKFLLLIIGAIACLSLTAVTIGAFLPVAHTASVSRSFAAQPAVMWATLNDEQFWANGSTADPKIRYQVLERIPERRLVRKIVGDNLPFGGTWTIELEPTGAGTRVRVTEDGEVYNPIFRFVSRFVIGHTTTMTKFMGDLGQRFGEA